MNEFKEGSKPSCDGLKNTFSTISLQKNDLPSPSRRSKRLQKDNLLESNNSYVSPLDKGLSDKNVENDITACITNSNKQTCSKNFQCESSEYLFDLYDQEMDISQSLNHKFYGCKRKGYPSPCGESFGLPDDPIFSNSPIFLDRTKSSPLDVDVANPCDICVLDLETIDQPWLVEYPEVITPYWDVESLFPFEVEDIRKKMEPEYDLSKQRTLSDSFNISSSALDVSADNNESECDNIFTSTPVKNQNNSLSVVSTINITSGENSNVNIAVLKDEVLKVLEEAIKKKNTIGNIDMKIQIVTSDLNSHVTLPKKSSVEGKANENVETESCRSSSSSKENYFIEKAHNIRDKSKNMYNAKELSEVTLSNLNNDWEDSPGGDVNQNPHELNGVNQFIKDNGAKKSKKCIKSRKTFTPGVRKNLRSQGSNISTTSDNASTSSTNQLSFDESFLKHVPGRTCKLLRKTRAPDNQLDNILISNEKSEQSLEIDSVNNKESHSDSKRTLRSSYSHKDVSLSVNQSEANISKYMKKPKNINFQDRDNINGFVGNQKQNRRIRNEGLQFSSDQNGIIRSKRRVRCINEDSQSSQDESDSTVAIGRSSLRVRESFKTRELQSYSIGKTSVERQKKNEILNIEFQTREKDRDLMLSIAGQTVDNIISSRQVVDLKPNNDVMNKMSMAKKNKSLIIEETLSSQDESDTIKNIEKIKNKEKPQSNDLLPSHNGSDTQGDTGKNVVEDQNKDTFLPNHSNLPFNKYSGRKHRGSGQAWIEDLQFSQDECGINKDDVHKSKRKRTPIKAKVQEKLSDVLMNTKRLVEESAKDQMKDNIFSGKRILRSSTQHLKPTDNNLKEGRRRTMSSSVSEKSTKEQNNAFPSRKRSVSANFDSERTPLRRSLRSQATDPTKVLENVKSPEYPTIKNLPNIFLNMKAPKISFNLSNSLINSPKNFDTNSPMKSILKNVYDSGGRLIGVKVHREKHVKLPSTLDIKPEDKDVKDTLSKEGLTYPSTTPSELELNSVKKEEEDCLRENGITSRIKIVISPLEIKEEVEEDVGRMCPVLPLMVPLSDVPPLRKSGRISNVAPHQESLESMVKFGVPNEIPQKNISEKSEIIVKSGRSNISEEIICKSKSESMARLKRNNGKIINMNDKTNPVESKEIKTEENDYSLGNFVWAQVGKYPYWPAVVCNDPITQTFQKEVTKQNMAPQIYYHIRFFGDYGRRAWVYRKHIMLYCSSEDLEQIANKLKSEGKNLNIVKPYLVSGSTHMAEKWHKAVKELNLLKNKKYEAIITHMVKSYEEHLKNRRKKKSHMLEASSESESEEPDACENRQRKKFKTSELPLVTADTQPTENKASEGFDEITFTIGPRNTVVPNTVLGITSETTSENTHIIEVAGEASFKQADKRPRKSLKDPENLTPSTPKLSVTEQSAKNAEIVSEAIQNSKKVTPRRSTRSLKAGESFHVTAETLDKNLDAVQVTNVEVLPESSETPNESLVKVGERRSLRVIKSSSSNDLSAGQSVESEKLVSRPRKTQPDERSEAESKSSSDGHSSNSNMYSFEYQMDLHKKNNLFNGLTKARVCDYCLKQGDLYKCKGRCGGFFHLDCASKVTQPLYEKRTKRREKSPSKAKARSAAPSIETTPISDVIEERCRTRNQCQVQIITIKSKHAIGTPKKVNLPDNFDELSLSEQIDCGMKEMMSKFENRTIYGDSADSSSEEGSIIASKNKQLGILDSPASSGAIESEKTAAQSSDLEENGEEEKISDDLDTSTPLDSAEKSNLIKHVTADSVILTESETPMDMTNLKCTYCRMELDPPCFACGLEVSKCGSSTRQKCSQYRCGRYYHPHCLKMWPQAQWSIGKWSRNQEHEDSFTCPAHTCHTCFSEELGSTACRLPGDKLARCMLCPAGFHTTTFCIPAGTDILGGSQIVCPRHRSKPTQPINTIWCFICSEGGNLICCDTCPTSVHPECQPINLTDDDKYICEDCESGRFPLYDEIVWVKLGQYRWWPALVLFPNEIPENVKALKHQRGDFAVRFFGTNDHYWVNKARFFLFQEGDRGGSPGEANKSKNRVYETFGKAIEDAALAYKLKKEYKLRREAESINSLKPPTYVKINKNKPVGNVKSQELDLSNATTCECDPSKPHPCGPDSNCINRLLMTECDPDVCSAGIRCRNQSFQKRDYPPMIPYKTQGRGWGLKCLAPIKKGQFVIEYVGELIDSEEYQRRIQKMHKQKEENYYFMTVDSERMIDAGPKGNLSRFMNHCCNPNCVTQKWTVRGDTRVGLFAKCDIETGSELTFNYNLEVVGQEKKVCKCGAGNCSGYIGVKAKSDKPEKSQIDTIAEPTEQRRPRKYNKKRVVSPPSIPPCFMCGRKQSDLTCNNKFCNKGYHLKCLKLEEMPEVTKFTCPRHNCNICSNRTIRCCVKCTNSFCPSHSDGNVRHDKFLGFVCRLHDPGISSTEITAISEPCKPTAQHSNAPSRNKNSKTKSINLYPPEKREEIRAAWRVYKRQQYARNKLLKLNSTDIRRKQSSNGKKSNIIDKQIGKTLAKSIEKQAKHVTLTQRNLTETLKTPSNSINNYRLGIKRRQRTSEAPNKIRKPIHETKKTSPLRQRNRLKKENKFEVQNPIMKNQVHVVTMVQEVINNQESDEITTQLEVVLNHRGTTSNPEKADSISLQINRNDVAEANASKPNVCNDTTDIKKNILETTEKNIQIPREDKDMTEDSNKPIVQNNSITSENHDDTNDILDVNQSEKSEFDPIKSTKRRRPKPELLTDESAVSSTTSDEDSKAPPPQRLGQKGTSNAEVNDMERDDLVSSTPPKELTLIPESKKFPEQTYVDTSEDELTLDQRVKRKSLVRHPRKKIKVNVKSFTSPAKTS